MDYKSTLMNQGHSLIISRKTETFERNLRDSWGEKNFEKNSTMQPEKISLATRRGITPKASCLLYPAKCLTRTLSTAITFIEKSWQ